MRVERRKKNMVVLGRSIGKVSRTERMFVSREEVRRRQAGRATVILVCIIAGMCAVLGILTVITDIIRPEVKNQLPGVSSDAANYDDADAMTLAFVRLDDKRVPEELVLTRFEPSEEKIYVSGLPLNTVCGGKTLSQHYAEGGAAQLEEAIAGLADCDRVFSLEYDYVQIRKQINYFDGVTITLDYGINYSSPNNDRNLNVVAGTRLYTGWELARLLDYHGWDGGERERLHMYAYVLSEFFNQNFKGFSEQSLLDYFAHICAYSTNDITTGSFHLASAGLLHLSETNDGDISLLVELEPELNSDGNYVFSGDSLLLIQAVYGNRDAHAE